jgi:excisionase family DNA binding protein
MKWRTDDLPSRMLTVRDIAFVLNVHTNTVRRWQKKGLLQAYSIGPRGNLRFRQEDVLEFLTRSKNNLSTRTSSAA